jgi:hypothetical protein
LPGEAHAQKGEAVSGDFVHGGGDALAAAWVGAVIDRLPKIEETEFIRAFKASDVTKNMVVTFAEAVRYFKGGDYEAVTGLVNEAV